MLASLYRIKFNASSHFIVTKVFFRKVADGDVGGFDKSAVFGWTVEVSVTVDGTVVLTNGLVIFDTDPNAWEVEKVGNEMS